MKEKFTEIILDSLAVITIGVYLWIIFFMATDLHLALHI